MPLFEHGPESDNGFVFGFSARGPYGDPHWREYVTWCRHHHPAIGETVEERHHPLERREPRDVEAPHEPQRLQVRAHGTGAYSRFILVKDIDTDTRYAMFDYTRVLDVDDPAYVSSLSRYAPFPGIKGNPVSRIELDENDNVLPDSRHFGIFRIAAIKKNSYRWEDELSPDVNLRDILCALKERDLDPSLRSVQALSHKISASEIEHLKRFNKYKWDLATWAVHTEDVPELMRVISLSSTSAALKHAHADVAFADLRPWCFPIDTDRVKLHFGSRQTPIGPPSRSVDWFSYTPHPFHGVWRMQYTTAESIFIQYVMYIGKLEGLEQMWGSNEPKNVREWSMYKDCGEEDVCWVVPEGLADGETTSSERTMLKIYGVFDEHERRDTRWKAFSVEGLAFSCQ